MDRIGRRRAERVGPMLIARAEIAGSGPFDVRVAGDRIAQIAERLEPESGEPLLEADGGALLPGLHDHHLHLFALAAAADSVRCGPPQVRDASQLAEALRRAPLRGGWVRGVGYCESVAGELDRASLDRLDAERPVRIQHRSGALWVVNSCGAQRLGLDASETPDGVERDADARATGRLFGVDAWLRARLGSSEPPSLAGVGRQLAQLGVTGVTDATPGNGPEEMAAFAAAVAGRSLPQRVIAMGRPGLPEAAGPGVMRGPVKILLEERALPAFAALERRIEAARSEGRPVAVHCVTRTQLVLAASALASVGVAPGDRIEHASVAPPDLMALLAALPVTVVTQPHFLMERGDRYAVDVDARDRAWLYRGRGFLDASVPLAAGTDAPFGSPDPWKAMRAAVDRRSESGLSMGADEALSPEQALALFTTRGEEPGGSPRRVVPGAVADLCLLDRPWANARETLRSAHVVATVCSGRLAWCAGAASGAGRASRASGTASGRVTLPAC